MLNQLKALGNTQERVRCRCMPVYNAEVVLSSSMNKHKKAPLRRCAMTAA
jgi:hypothetical protein